MVLLLHQVVCDNLGGVGFELELGLCVESFSANGLQSARPLGSSVESAQEMDPEPVGVGAAILFDSLRLRLSSQAARQLLHMHRVSPV